MFQRASTTRWYSTGNSRRSPHAQWYSDVLPAMIPIFLLGSAVYLGLQLAQTRLSHEKYMHDAKERVERLEAEIESLQQDRHAASTETIPKDRSWWRW
ncbi:hypothetical protein E1B28_004518 [Marasmius oreades]|uniref:Uncharacterized protein n=1 Tax=Marasmius oreades TaxID=181124 RepID=A0A9P8ADB1_9AGAR|nr:uncharacterized protein E1B28_004518 [Marasmius oreades]KAG7097140.1 hypothetical protein E1B28_004518 [Marasmius oreades]